MEWDSKNQVTDLESGDLEIVDNKENNVRLFSGELYKGQVMKFWDKSTVGCP